MSEYIEREVTIESICAETCGCQYAECGRTIDDKMCVCTYLEMLPAADVAPVVHGEWLLVGEYPASDWILDYDYVCSECGFQAKTCAKGEYLTKYCPNCGAKMDKEGEND